MFLMIVIGLGLEGLSKANLCHVVVLNARPFRVFVLLTEAVPSFLVAFAHLTKSEPATSGESGIGHPIVCTEEGVNLDLVLAIIPASVGDQFLNSCASPVDDECHPDVRGEARSESDRRSGD